MAKLESLIQTINILTGTATRHNRALREIGDLLKELNNFVSEFNTPETVFENIVKARVDISAFMYKIRKGEKTFRHIKSKGLMPLLMDIYNNLESVRVDAYNPQKGKFTLNKSLSNLRASFETLKGEISNIEFK